MEKRFLLPAIFVSFALFLLRRAGLLFLAAAQNDSLFLSRHRIVRLGADWTVQQYYSFVTRFTIGFGLAFELPVVVLALVRFGLITYSFMARTRPYAIVLIFVLATIITPTPDILTLIAMGLPMCLLYESCIWIAWLIERRRSNAYPVNFVEDRGFEFVFERFCVRSRRCGWIVFECLHLSAPSDLSSTNRDGHFVRIAKNRSPGIKICR